jgi:monomeric isocitrate dehydrogenase
VCFSPIFLLQTVSAALAELLEMRSLASLYIINIAFSFTSIPQLKTPKKILQNFGLSDLEDHSCREVEEEDDEELVLDLLQFSKKSCLGL